MVALPEDPPVTVDSRLAEARQDREDERALAPEGRRAVLAKAIAAEAGIEPEAALSLLTQREGVWGQLAAVVPAYDPEALQSVVEQTPHLRPCIDALTQNIDGWGQSAVEVVPWLRDLDSDEATTAIEAALAVEAWVDAQADEAAEASETAYLQRRLATTQGRDQRRLARKLEEIQPDVAPAPSVDVATEVDGIREELRVALARERAVFDAWFAHCCLDRSFVALRKALREDVLTHGWGCCEFLRDHAGRLSRLVYLPAFTVRPLDDPGQFVPCTVPDPITVLRPDRTALVHRRFLRFVQIVGAERRYFKSPGDPHVVSRATGRCYASLEDLRRPSDLAPDQRPGEGTDAVPANELLWIARHDARTPCPPPVWVGNLVMALGTREADQTNYYYLQGNAIPAGMLMIHGGALRPGDAQRLEQRWAALLRGAKGAGRIIVVEAIPSGDLPPGERTAQPGMSYQGLRESQTTDQTFAGYDVRAADRIGASFRLPPLLRGYTSATLNRATAWAALQFAEQQVFAPAREDWDYLMNTVILPEIGVSRLRFRSNTAPTRTPEDVAQLVQALAPHGGFTPAEVRTLAADVLTQPLQDIDADWTTRPLPLTLAGITGDGAPAPSEAAALNESLRTIESRVAALVTEELRAVGLDGHMVRAHVLGGGLADPTNGEGASDG